MIAEVLTEWVGDGNTPDTAMRPRLMDDHPSICRFIDTTNQNPRNRPQSVNMYAVKIVCSDEVIAAIESDSKYRVLWKGDERNNTPPKAEFGGLVSFLASGGVNVSEVIGSRRNGRTRKEITDELRAWMSKVS